MTKLGQMVLKEVNWVHNDKIRSKYGLERSHWYIMIKLGQWSWVHNAWSYAG